MTNRDKRNRLLVLLIFGMTIIPFAIAWLLGGKAPFIKGQINKGQLISPVITTGQADYSGLDAFSADNIGEMKGKWLIINVVPETQCGTYCKDAIYKTKQLHLMMSKDLIRIRRIVLFLKDVPAETANQWLQDDKVLLKLKPNQELSRKLNGLRGGHIPDGMLLLADPLGNVMMQYEPGFDPYKVKSDLMHLLRISQIG